MSSSRLHPVIVERQHIETSIRSALSTGHEMSCAELLSFCEELVSLADDFVLADDFSSALVLANRCELLTRQPHTARHHRTDEDWLVLAATPPSSRVAAEVEAMRSSLHDKALQLVAFSSKSAGLFTDARRAMEELLSVCDPPRTATMLNHISVLMCIDTEEAEAEIFRYGSEVIDRLSSELQKLLEPELSSILVNGSVEQRSDYHAQRICTASMLITGQLYLNETLEKRARRRKDAPSCTLYYCLRVTLQYAELWRLCVQELGTEHDLFLKIQRAVANWSAWLAGPSSMDADGEAASSRWKVQLTRSRAIAMKNYIAQHRTHPALEMLYTQHGECAGLGLLLMSRSGQRASLGVNTKSQRRSSSNTIVLPPTPVAPVSGLEVSRDSAADLPRVPRQAGDTARIAPKRRRMFVPEPKELPNLRKGGAR